MKNKKVSFLMASVSNNNTTIHACFLDHLTHCNGRRDLFFLFNIIIRPCLAINFRLIGVTRSQQIKWKKRKYRCYECSNAAELLTKVFIDALNVQIQNGSLVSVQDDSRTDIWEKPRNSHSLKLYGVVDIYHGTRMWIVVEKQQRKLLWWWQRFLAPRRA